MSSVSLRDLLEAGVHFGHQTRSWNPKMGPYIYGEKNGIHIIDLQKTAHCLGDALRFASSVASRGQSVIFVGTKRAARDIIANEAERSNMYYVNNRWLGGTLTNFQTVKKSIDRLINLEKARDEGKFDLLTKKEALDLTRKIAKMEKSLGGIKSLKGVPACMFVIDPRREYIAVSEARKLKIPVIALCDTNCDPDGITHVIPGNDDAIKSIQLFTGAIADAVVEGQAASRDGSEEAVAANVDVENVEIYRRGAAADDESAAASEDAVAEEAAAEGAPDQEAAAEDAAAEDAPAEEEAAEEAPAEEEAAEETPAEEEAAEEAPAEEEAAEEAPAEEEAAEE